MSQIAYEEVLQRVQELTPDEQLRLVEELATLVRQQRTPQVRWSISQP